MMFNNLKIRISLWYSILLTLILASALFASYKIIGLQLKSEIENDLKTKANTVKYFFIENEKSSKSNGEAKHHGEEEGEGSQEHEGHTFQDIQIYTETPDNNYVMYIYAEGELKYLTERYEKTKLAVYPSEISDGNVIDVDFNGIPFTLTALNMPEFTLYIGYELSSLADIQQKILKIFLYIFPIGLIFSFIFGFMVTQRSMNVVKRISITTDSITSSNLSNRISVPRGKDEITQLILTLNSMIDRLEKSFAQAKQFSQDAAHEIRTPLTIIRGEIEEILENSPVNETTIKTLENVLEEIQYLTSISERLLLIHKMDTNKIKYHFESVDLSTLMYEISQDAEIMASDKNIEVSLDCTDGIYFNGNKELITRLLWNLMDNAIKYNQPNGKINLNLKRDKTGISINVKDSGIGIPPEEIPKIFERFYRVDKSRSRRLGGSGLGLAICKWILELHNGEILVTSEVYRGTNFSVIFPEE